MLFYQAEQSVPGASRSGYFATASVDSAINSERPRTRMDFSNERDFTASSICVMQKGQPTARGLGAGGVDLVESFLIDSLSILFFFFPKAPAACAAAERAILAQMHVAHLRARNRTERRTRCPTCGCAAPYGAGL
jgi:hypothetical protein